MGSRRPVAPRRGREQAPVRPPFSRSERSGPPRRKASPPAARSGPPAFVRSAWVARRAGRDGAGLGCALSGAGAAVAGGGGATTTGGGRRLRRGLGDDPLARRQLEVPERGGADGIVLGAGGDAGAQQGRAERRGKQAPHPIRHFRRPTRSEPQSCVPNQGPRHRNVTASQCRGAERRPRCGKSATTRLQ